MNQHGYDFEFLLRSDHPDACDYTVVAKLELESEPGEAVTMTADPATGYLVVNPTEKMWGQIRAALPGGAVESGPRNDKFSVHLEDGLWRITALRDGAHFQRGERGGLLSDPSLLSQEGDCWVDVDAKVLNGARVCGDAWIADDSMVTDGAVVQGAARVLKGSCISGVATVVGGYAAISDSRVQGGRINGHATVDGSELNVAACLVGGRTSIQNSKVCGLGYCEVLSGCLIDADINGLYQHFHISTSHGSLDAYRGVDGDGRVVLRVAVGCQRKNGFAELFEVAAPNGALRVEVQMLEHFEQMVKQATVLWKLPDGQVVVEGFRSDGLLAQHRSVYADFVNGV